jgi:hypothetical protein
MDAFIDFLRRFSWPFGLTAGIYAFALRFIPKMQIELSLYLSIIFALLAVIVTLITYLSDNNTKLEEPKIIVEEARNAGKLLLIKKTDRLGINMYAQIFFRDQDFELYLGVSKVINVQNNGMVQLLIISDLENQVVAAGLSENRSETKKRIIVKPAVIMREPAMEIANEELI